MKCPIGPEEQCPQQPVNVGGCLLSPAADLLDAACAAAALAASYYGKIVACIWFDPNTGGVPIGDGLGLQHFRTLDDTIAIGCDGGDDASAASDLDATTNGGAE
jgi:hypothetical protein